MKTKKFTGKHFSVKSLLSLAIAAVFLLSSANAVMAENVSQIIGSGNTVVFVDVPNDYWAKDQIDYFTSQGIVDGYEDGSFRPEDGVTREEFCKLLVSTFGQALETPETPTFADVPEDRWSYPYIEICSEFLTGYSNPFGGLPSFHPTEYATREDIAVALVRMMGYTDGDAYNKYYAASHFTDGSQISPGLLPYVSIACEKGLISGYPDGSFGPTNGITRAETVVLLNRATKQAVTNINADLDLSASVIYSEDGKTATINITAEEGATVTVNGEAVKMSRNYYDQYEGNYVYKFEEEGSKTFTVEGTKSGKTKSVNVTAKYEIGAPVLSVTYCPTSSDKESVTIKGMVKDVNSYYREITLTVNGINISVDYDGSWEKNVKLTEGDNTITITATNALGKTTTEKRTVTFGVGSPTLTITSCPTSSDEEEIMIKGTVKDVNSYYREITLTVNGEDVSVDYDGSWKKNVKLTEGDNTITITATNALGKSTTETKTVTFDVGAPTLTITSCPTSSDGEEIMIKGTVKDVNSYYREITLTINGVNVSVDYDGSWKKNVKLTEGDNTITITATNALGKSTTETKTVTFDVGAPTLTITSCPTSSDGEEIMIKGTVKDVNSYYREITLTINGVNVSVDYDGSWKKYVKLTEGENTITITATNALGKSTTEIRRIERIVGDPEITFINCPETTTNSEVTIKGKITGENNGAMLFINDKEVSVDYNGGFSKNYKLSEGENTFTFRAVNGYGKSVTETKTIVYAPVEASE